MLWPFTKDEEALRSKVKAEVESAHFDAIKTKPVPAPDIADPEHPRSIALRDYDLKTRNRGS